MNQTRCPYPTRKSKNSFRIEILRNFSIPETALIKWVNQTVYLHLFCRISIGVLFGHEVIKPLRNSIIEKVKVFFIITEKSLPNYSTVAKGRCRGTLKNSDLIFNFAITYRSPAFTGNHYSEYQLFLYQTITEHREQSVNFDAISDWLNEIGYLTVRGKKFRGENVHSIVKKKRLKDEKLERVYQSADS